MNKAWHFILCYIISIIIFGAIYWVHYFFYPDSFIISEQFNLHPFSSQQVFNNEQSRTLNYYQAKSDSLRMRLRADQVELVEYHKKSDSVKKALGVAYKKLELSRQVNIVLKNGGCLKCQTH